MQFSRSCTVCFALALLWVGVIGALGYVHWPHFPLDLSPIDPAVIRAMRRAVIMHVAGYAAVAFLPPLLLWLILKKRKGGTS